MNFETCRVAIYYEIRTKKPRFILIDPSFDGKSGDKWQYAVAFQESAVRNGYEFILLSHVLSPMIHDDMGKNVDQRNIFLHNFYGHGDIVSRNKKTPKRQALKSADFIIDERYRALEAKILKYRSEGRYVDAARTEDLRASMIEDHIRVTAPLLNEITYQEAEPQPFNRDDFASAMVDQIKKISPKKGDILFLHTTTQAMLESLTEISARLESDKTLDVDAYFLFHFGADAPDARTFIDRYYSFSHFDSLKLRLSTGSPFRRVHLLATSKILRDELEKHFGLPVGLFDGLCNFDQYLEALGGLAAFNAARALALEGISRREIAIGVRVADLDDERLKALAEASNALTAAGFNPVFRLAYHNNNWSKGVEFISQANGDFRLVNTNDNSDYIRFLAESTFVILPYKPEIYLKRVSAVLHDCSVMGISVIVPRGTTLADGREFADIYEYSLVENLPSTLLRAATALKQDSARSAAKQSRALDLFGSDVITRLLQSTSEASITVLRRGPVATVVMPLWGRVGSTYAFNAQIEYLLKRGYFVVQVFSVDKIVDPDSDLDYFWKMLLECSGAMRGSIQRIAYRHDNVPTSELPAQCNGYDSFERNIGRNSLHDEIATHLTRSSVVTVVNHVFNTQLARSIGSGKFILETHDIQSIQMAAWPLRNPFTNEPEGFHHLLSSEMRSVATYDYVINVAESEHARLKHANSRARVVTPYVAVNNHKPKYESVSSMAFAHNWHESYQGIFKFDVLLMGDAHPANVESAIWFINNVFIPMQQVKAVRLGVVGRLSNSLYEKLGGIPNVFYCGFVDDITSVRYLSEIILLPDKRGSGISIKTLETLAYGGAFVATSVAFRGLAERLSEQPPVHDDPHSFMEQILQLLADKEMRSRLEDWASKAYYELASEEAFQAAWDDVFNELGLTISYRTV